MPCRWPLGKARYFGGLSTLAWHGVFSPTSIDEVYAPAPCSRARAKRCTSVLCPICTDSLPPSDDERTPPSEVMKCTLEDVASWMPSDSSDEEEDMAAPPLFPEKSQDSEIVQRIERATKEEEEEVNVTDVSSTTSEKRDSDSRDDISKLMDYLMNRECRREFFKQVDYCAEHKPAKLLAMRNNPLFYAREIVRKAK